MGVGVEGVITILRQVRGLCILLLSLGNLETPEGYQ
jgi:hypothetical protein